jgi:predicted dehydrogenase
MKTAGAAGVLGRIGFPNILHAQNKGDKLRVAFVGVGGIGGQHTGFASKAEDICNCFCDVDESRWENANKRGRWPGAKGYRDYREMYEKEKDNFDAVMVGVPDHTHYPATILAMQMGKHV